jgi:tRNA threonylcarbamoyladenosine biosynthesis protein TsaB
MLLAIDTSTAYMGVAFHEGTAVLGEMNWRAGHHATQQLMACVENLWRLIRQSGTAPGDVQSNSPHTGDGHAPPASEGRSLPLSAVVVAAGPGSFSGLRAGMSVAKGLALALDIPLVAVPTLDVIAYPHVQSTGHVCALLEAGRDQLYVGWYRAMAGKWRRLEDYAILDIEQICEKIVKKTVICGELTAAHREALAARLGKYAVFPAPAFNVRRAAVLAEIGTQWLAKKWIQDPVTVEPLYLRRPAARALRDRIFPELGTST